MHITELLVTGYDGDEPVLAVNLVPGTATVAVTKTDLHGDNVLESTWNQASQAFTGVRDLVEGLAMPARQSSALAHARD